MEAVPRPSASGAREQWTARWHAWRSDRRIAAALFACIALAAAAAWFHASTGGSSALPPPAPPSSFRNTGSRASVFASSTTRPPPIVVDVVGAVQRAGVVRLGPGARVVDAVAAAGGATPDADLGRLNLAAPLADGSRVAVPRAGAPAPALDPAAVSVAPPAVDGSGRPDSGGPDRSGPGRGPVNLNTATASDLDALPGIGPATAAAIVSDRSAHGPFRSVDDLGRVRGIGDAKLAQLRPLVTV